MKAFYDHEPQKIEAIGDGYYRYRWNIEESVETHDGVEVRQWSCSEVCFWPLSANAITEKVISSCWPGNYEQKLVNEYNAAVLGVFDEVTANVKTVAYTVFLKERQALKDMIDDDCRKLGIL